jgi:hypothetical protein
LRQPKKNNLESNLIIRKLLAGFLLVVFAFGITPKRTLHNLLADHKDGKTSASARPVGTVLARASFNCQCDNLISESPFVSDSVAEEITATNLFPVFITGGIQQPVSSSPLSFSLRGPPAC